jgi:tetratricopeptide (TPR) repeat protein
MQRHPSQPPPADGLAQGLALHQQGRLAEAVACYEAVLRAQPDRADALHLLGTAALQSGDAARAAACLGRAVTLKPDLAGAHNNLGVACKELGRWPEALRHYDAALRLAPHLADAHANRGVALMALGDPLAALASFEQALARNANLAQAWGGRGDALQRLGRREEALACYDRATTLAPAHADAWSNRGVALHFLARFDEAIDSFDAALRCAPAHADAHLNKAFTSLLLGRLQAGWPLHEWRHQADAARNPDRGGGRPRWQGEPLAGRTVLLYHQQGFGDTLQFCRFASEVARRGARVVLEVPDALVRVLRGLDGVSEIVETGQPLPPFDFHCPLLSLPLVLGTTLQSIPAAPAYLRAEPALVDEWADRLGPRRAPRVGLAWSGSVGHTGDRERSLALESLLRALPPGLEYVSLQKELRSADAAAIAAAPGIRHFGDALRDFADTAALCACMDGVVSVDTSVAHLAAALGRPTWLLLPHVPDWRWLLGRDDSPWYPSMRLYRQGADRTWAGVLARVGTDLGERTWDKMSNV